MKFLALVPLVALAAAARADRAIVIGINDYRDPNPPKLYGPQNDAADMAACYHPNATFTDAVELIHSDTPENDNSLHDTVVAVACAHAKYFEGSERFIDILSNPTALSVFSGRSLKACA